MRGPWKTPAGTGPALALLLLLASAGSARSATQTVGSVTLPLDDYHALLERIETRQRDQAARQADREPAVRELVRTEIEIEIDDDGAGATIEARLRVELRGRPTAPVPLPVPGVAARASVMAGGEAALDRAGDGTLRLIAPRPGSYDVTVHARADLGAHGVGRLTLPASGSPVTVARVSLPAALGWSCEGAVVVSEREAGGRRRLELALDRDRAHLLTVQRQLRDTAAEDLLARSTVVTVVELMADGPRRRDLVSVEVLRGGLDAFALRVPPALEVERVITDEGPAIPADDGGGTLRLERMARLRGLGRVSVRSRPRLAGDTLPLPAIVPAIAPRARYLVLVTARAAAVTPRPAAAWQRVDLDDLPAPVRAELEALGPSGAWRLLDEGAETALAIEVLPPAARQGAVVRRRETTSVLTVDGTLVHRDQLEVIHGEGALALTLPPGVELWSASVAGQPVRPIARDGRLLVPLALATGGAATVEVVSRSALTLPVKRGRADLALPSLGEPVLAHHWRLLLPEDHRYRVASSVMRRVPRPSAIDPWSIPNSAPGVTVNRPSIGGTVRDTDGNPLPGVTVTVSGEGRAPMVTTADSAGRFLFGDLPPGDYSVTAELDGFSTLDYPNVRVAVGRATSIDMALNAAIEETITITSGAPSELRAFALKFGSKVDTRDAESAREAQAAVDALRQGLVGGVKPLAVTIPEHGKVLRLAAVLPPATVAVTLDVARARR